MFFVIQPLFLLKSKPYILIPNIHLGLGFEFGPQRIMDLAFVCPWSVVSDKHLYSLTLNITLHILLPVYFAMHGEIAMIACKNGILLPKLSDLL